MRLGHLGQGSEPHLSEWTNPLVPRSCLYAPGCRDIPWSALSMPWENLLRTSWPLFDLVANWSRIHRETTKVRADMRQLCGEKSLHYLHKFDGELLDWQISRLHSTPKVLKQAAQLLAAGLLDEVHLQDWPRMTDPCGRLLWSTLIVTLALVRDGAAISTGYGLRVLWLHVMHSFLELEGLGLNSKGTGHKPGTPPNPTLQNKICTSLGAPRLSTHFPRQTSGSLSLQLEFFRS